MPKVYVPKTAKSRAANKSTSSGRRTGATNGSKPGYVKTTQSKSGRTNTTTTKPNRSYLKHIERMKQMEYNAEHAAEVEKTKRTAIRTGGMNTAEAVASGTGTGVTAVISKQNQLVSPVVSEEREQYDPETDSYVYGGRDAFTGMDG